MNRHNLQKGVVMRFERHTHANGQGGFWILPFLAVSWKQRAFVVWFGWLYWMWGLWFNGATPDEVGADSQPTTGATRNF
jgi:hypothetical protein